MKISTHPKQKVNLENQDLYEKLCNPRQQEELEEYRKNNKTQNDYATKVNMQKPNFKNESPNEPLELKNTNSFTNKTEILGIQLNN